MSVTFIDGPARDIALALKRAPLYLRVVCVPRTHKWDALDMPGDEPKASEQIIVYRRAGKARFFYFKFQTKSQSGYYAHCEYRIVHPQPADSVVRDTPAWRDWCMSQIGGDNR